MAEPNKPLPVCYILVGPPGVGKTTYRQQFSNLPVLSTDDYLLKIAAEQGRSYNDVFKEHFGAAQKAYDMKMRELIQARQSFMVDRTNLTIKSRKRILSQLPREYASIAVVFTIPSVEELERRISKRAKLNGQYVPVSVIKELLDRYEIPTTDEGFLNVVSV